MGGPPTGKGLLKIESSKQSVGYGRAPMGHPMVFLAPRKWEGCCSGGKRLCR